MRAASLESLIELLNVGKGGVGGIADVLSIGQDRIGNDQYRHAYDAPYDPLSIADWLLDASHLFVLAKTSATD
jgi:hypothetical protein